MDRPYDVFDDRCPTRLALDRLDDGPVRFNQLRRDIRGLSQKVLSQTLKRLERDGLVERTVRPTVPVGMNMR